MHHNAFVQDWSQETLWICPPFSLLDNVIEKIFSDHAHGIMLIPVWKHQPWFMKLSTIALSWWNIPHEVSVLQTPSGRVIPPRKDMLLRVVYFDALDPGLHEIIPMHWMDMENSMDVTPLRCFASTSSSPGNTSIPDIDWECPSKNDLITLRGVIASATQHPDASSLVDKIMALYHDELH